LEIEKCAGFFAIALAFVILEAFAGLQPASAAAPKCVPTNCHVYYGTHGPVTTCDQRWADGPRGAADHPATEKQENEL